MKKHQFLGKFDFGGEFEFFNIKKKKEIGSALYIRVGRWSSTKLFFFLGLISESGRL